MKKVCKGFTLVELLIIVAILAVLTSTMMVSMSGSTAKTKAASIAANLDSCRTAAMLYYSKHGDEAGISKTTTTTMLEESLKTWGKMKGDKDKDNIYYTAGSTNAKNAPDKWAVLVDFSNDPEAEEIAKALKNMKGYSDSAFMGGGVFDLLFGAKAAFAAEGDNSF